MAMEEAVGVFMVEDMASGVVAAVPVAITERGCRNAMSASWICKKRRSISTLAIANIRYDSFTITMSFNLKI